MKFFYIIILLITVIIILNIFYKKTNYYRNEILQLEKFKSIPKNLKIINLGSSYARNAFLYDELSLEGFNFGLQPQSLSYDFRILQNYKEKLDENCIVIITLPQLVFGFLNYENDSMNYKYYHFLKSEYILNYTKFKDCIIKKLPLLLNPTKVYRLFKDVKLINLEKEENILTEKEVKEEAFLRINGWKNQFNLKNVENMDGIPTELKIEFEKTTELLKEIINYCKINKLRPILIVPPCSKILNEFIGDEFLNEVLYKNIYKSKDNTLFLDYLKDERFQDYKLYINSDMLNKEGRMKFTKQVIQDLNTNGVNIKIE